MTEHTEHEETVVPYGKFEMPDQIVVETEKEGTFARFVAEPFGRGFGHTIGNSLRRMMLSSLEAPALVGVRIEGVSHEYMAVEGIIEDMTNIVLNFKRALLRKVAPQGNEIVHDDRILTSMMEVTQSDLDQAGGAVEVTLGDLVVDTIYEVVNPEQLILTVTQPMKRQVDLRVAMGRGYVPSERHEILDKMTDEIIIDSAFSPVRLVNYWVENTRVGQDTDYDRLVLEVTTDGRLTPSEALNFATQILSRHLEVFASVRPYVVSFEEGEIQPEGDHDEIMQKLALRIDEIELSVRSTNCLSGANIGTIAELVSIPERRMLEFRNFGKKSLNEIKGRLAEMGLGLGMDLSRYGITSENVKEKVAEYLEQASAKPEGSL